MGEKTHRFERCWVKGPDGRLCDGKAIGGQGEKGICKKHLDAARVEGRDPFLPPPRKKEKLYRVMKNSDGSRAYGFVASDEGDIEDHGTKEEMLDQYKPEYVAPLVQRNPPRGLDRFSRDFFRAVVVDVDHGWKDHFRGVLREIIGDFEGTINKGTEANRRKRFAHKRVNTLVAKSVKKMHIESGKRIVDARYGKSSYEKGLAFFNDLGVIKRATLGKQRGWVVAPHGSCCYVTNGQDCRFQVGALKGLPEPLDLDDFDWQPGAFHQYRPDCPCDICTKIDWRLSQHAAKVRLDKP